MQILIETNPNTVGEIFIELTCDCGKILKTGGPGIKRSFDVRMKIRESGWLWSLVAVYCPECASREAQRIIREAEEDFLNLRVL